MSEFRPYVEKSLGQLPNLNVRHVVSDGSITSYKSLLSAFERVSSTHRISANTNVDARKANIMGYGDITVSTDGSSTTYERISEAKAFVSAIERERVAVYDRENPWYKEQENNLEEFGVQIPRYPDSMIYLHWGQRAYGFRPNVLIDKGDWVREGQPIVEGAGAHIKAPFSGRVQNVGWSAEPVLGWSLSEHWPTREVSGVVSNLNATTYAVIQPLKGQDIHGAVQKAYSQFFNSAANRFQEIQGMKYKKLIDTFYRNESDYSPDGFREMIEHKRKLINSMKKSEARFTPPNMDYNDNWIGVEKPYKPPGF